MQLQEYPAFPSFPFEAFDNRETRSAQISVRLENKNLAGFSQSTDGQKWARYHKDSQGRCLVFGQKSAEL